jgi:hypothetical protein
MTAELQTPPPRRKARARKTKAEQPIKIVPCGIRANIPAPFFSVRMADGTLLFQSIAAIERHLSCDALIDQLISTDHLRESRPGQPLIAPYEFGHTEDPPETMNGLRLSAILTRASICHLDSGSPLHFVEMGGWC